MLMPKEVCSLIFTFLVWSPVAPDVSKCGYDVSCPKSKPNMINVHLVPHTHDDVGWLKTFDEYYRGDSFYHEVPSISVRQVLDSVLFYLEQDPSRRFTFVEIAYFWKWWKQQNADVRNRLTRLVENGQFEFANGGWTMNDEAVTNYQSIIDQFTLGLGKLNQTFGECGRPRAAWQVDTFGHSKEMASILAGIGFDGLFISRLDYNEKRTLLANKSAELLWKGSISEIFTHILYYGYYVMRELCFDILCRASEPIFDRPKSSYFNVDQKIDFFLSLSIAIAEHFVTNDIIFPMGVDFSYMDAFLWYSNMDKIIKYVNLKQKTDRKVNVFYSTPSCYLKAVNTVGTNFKWPVKYDDFLPYASGTSSYWTGFYTSRPTLKRYERVANNFLQVCKQLYVLADLPLHYMSNLNKMREAVAVLQHHDAITGTQSEYVAKDHARILSEGFHSCGEIASQALNQLMANETSSEMPVLNQQSCPLLNISQCKISETERRFLVTIYNPLSRNVSKYIRLPVTGLSYLVQDSTGAKLKTQIVPIHTAVLSIPGRISDAKNELVFKASDIPPIGYESFYVYKRTGTDSIALSVTSEVRVLDGKGIRARFSKTGTLISVSKGSLLLPVEQSFFWYKGSTEIQVSGAYVFNPASNILNMVTKKVSTVVYKGQLVEEVHQVFNPWISQVVRVYKEEEYVELEWLVGPIPTKDFVGKEVISLFKTSLKNGATFFTDSNGRGMVKRVRNFRPTFKAKIAEVSGNYYPVTSAIEIRDEMTGVNFAVLTDRAQGGSSLKEGQLELMVHRACVLDDSFGVSEPLLETAYKKGVVARGKHLLMFGPAKSGTENFGMQRKLLAQGKMLDSWTFLSSTNNIAYKPLQAALKMRFAGLRKVLPITTQLLTMEPWYEDKLLLRFEDITEESFGNVSRNQDYIHLDNLFTTLSVLSMDETSLGANQWLGKMKRLKWKEGRSLEIEKQQNRKDDDATYKQGFQNSNQDPNLILLHPMQIRTFIASRQRNHSNSTTVPL